MKNVFLLSLLISLNFPHVKSQGFWTDISTKVIFSEKIVQNANNDKGCSGVIVNRLNGDVIINITENGLWRSSDQGNSFMRIDQGKVGGLNQTAWSIQVDQDNPQRIANFSLDGTAAFTSDGVKWITMTDQGRNWDLGAIDWSSPDPKVILAARHDNGEINLSIDGGQTWEALSVKVKMNETFGVMIGVIDSTTLLYSNVNGIFRSIDQGATWKRVSLAVTRSKVAVMFKGACYLGTTSGIFVSKDKGATWARLSPTKIDVLQGPYFGEDEHTMVIVSTEGMHKSIDAGQTWNLISSLASVGNSLIKDVVWEAHYVWDPVYNICYASAMTNPAYKIEIIDEVTGITLSPDIKTQILSVYPNPSSGIINISGNNIHKSEVFNLNGNSYGFYYGNVIDLSSLQAGTYVINVYDANGSLLKTNEIVLSK